MDDSPSADCATDLLVLCEASEVAAGEMRTFEPPGCEALALYNVGGCFYVTADLCTHGQASLSFDGALSGHVVECGWHCGAFDVRSGEPLASPCEVPLKTYPVILHAGRVCVRMRQCTAAPAEKS